MIWHKGQFLYKGRMISAPSEWAFFQAKRELTMYAMPVPGGRIVDFEERENEHKIRGRYALYKVTARLKGG